MMDIDQFFNGFPKSQSLYDRLLELARNVGQIDLHVTRSQIALYRVRPFAWIWIPDKYLKRKAAPLVLSIVFPERDPSTRWKEIVEPSKGKYMHHLEIFEASEIDDDIVNWLRRAWTDAGN